MSKFTLERIYSNPITDTVNSVKKAATWVKNKGKEYKDNPENIKKDAKSAGKFIKENPGLVARGAAELATGYVAVPWLVNKGLGKAKFFKKHKKLKKGIAAASVTLPIGEAMLAADIAHTLKKKNKEKKNGSL